MIYSSHATGSFRRRILKLTAFFGILLLCFLLFITAIFYAKRVWILEQVQSYVAGAQSGELQVDNMELALLKHLPNVTIKLSEIRYYEHGGEGRPDDELPIVSARDLYIAFEPWQLLRHSKLLVSEVSVEEGTVNLVQYNDNMFNLELALASPGSSDSLSGSAGEERFSTVTLQSVEMNHILFSYRNLVEEQSSEAFLTHLEGKISLNETGIDLTLLIDFQIISSSRRSVLELLGPVGIDVNLSLARSSKQLVLHSGLMTVGNVVLKMNGTYDHFDDQELNLFLDASAGGFKLLSKVVQEDVVKRNRSRLEKATVVLKGRVHGKVRNRAPMADVTFAVKNVNLQLAQDIGDFQDVGFEGEFHTGYAADFSEASLIVKNLNGSVPGGHLSGDFMCSNFVEPYLRYDLDLDFLLDGYEKIFRIQEIDSLTGGVALKAKFDGPLKFRKQMHPDSLSAWTLEVNKVGFKYLPTDKVIANLDGRISERENEVELRDLRLEYDGSDLLLNGVIRNLYGFIFGNDKNVEADLVVKSHQLFTNHFVLNPNLKPLVGDRITDLTFTAKISGDSINHADSLHYQVIVEDMSFQMDKLPGVSKLNARGNVFESENKLIIKLQDFHAEMPYGVANISGNMVMPKGANRIDINAHVNMIDFPWTYASDLINEMSGTELVGSKNMTPDEMEIWNSDLDLSATIEHMPFAINNLELRRSSLSILKADSQYFDFKNAGLEIKDLRFLREPETERILGVQSGACDIIISSFGMPAIKKSAVNLSVDVIQDKYDASFSMLSELAESEQGSLAWDRNLEVPTFKANYDARAVPIESIVREYYSNRLVEGDLNVSLALSGEGRDWSAIKENVSGTIALTSDSLMLYGIDIDDALKKYEKSQKFDLVDVGAVMLAGPLGAVVSKGSDLGKLATINFNDTKRTPITGLLAKWAIHDGLIETEDVALTTPLNRLAFVGQVDFVNDTIPGYTIYVLDKNACSLMDQRIYGKLNDIQVGKLNIAKTLFGSVINFVNAVVGKDCEPVYSGALLHPNSMK
ncbi:MAG: AsmA-like C-terminal region-containing protein [Cyclobacteriaceae bacterium]